MDKRVLTIGMSFLAGSRADRSGTTGVAATGVIGAPETATGIGGGGVCCADTQPVTSAHPSLHIVTY